MAIVTGPVVDVSGARLDGVLWAQTSVIRTDGTKVIAPQRVRQRTLRLAHMDLARLEGQ